MWFNMIHSDSLWSYLIHLIFCISKGKKRWIHRFTEHFAPASLSCISAGQSLVALGSKDGQIHVYESSNEFKCLRLVTILAHHTGAIHTVIFHDGKLLSGSDDMSVGIVNITGEDSSKSKLILSKLLQAKICTKYRKHWKNYVSFQLSGQTWPCLANSFRGNYFAFSMFPILGTNLACCKCQVDNNFVCHIRYYG